MCCKALGPTDPAIEADTLGPLLLGTFDKTLFSMMTPDVKAILDARPGVESIVIFGIEVRSQSPFKFLLFVLTLILVAYLCPANCVSDPLRRPLHTTCYC